MSKKIFLYAILILCWAPCLAQEINSTQRWFEQVDGGFVFPAGTTAKENYDAGYGGDIVVGCRFAPHFSLSANLGFYHCDEREVGSSGGEWLYVPLMAVGRYSFGEGWLRPYVMAGAGFAFNTYSFTPVAPAVGPKLSREQTDPVLSAGAGVFFILFRDAAFFVQGRMDADFTGQVSGAPEVDNPSLFIPLKAGISFMVP